MSEVSKLTFHVAQAAAEAAAQVTKITIYVATTSTPTTPVRKKAHGRIRYYDAGE